ncbi:MAG: type II secretion system F family protein [Deltaproteobacteria bacterium]|nr:type II secretion system F family protein [Candidatus Anaeroferrophillacea bacterium]
MPRFSFEVMNPGGERYIDSAEAADREALLLTLQQQGLVLIRWLDASGRRRSGAGGRNWGAARTGMRRTEVLDFTRELAHLTTEGVPVDRALGVIADVVTAGAVRETAGYLRTSLQEGKSLSAAMADRPREFNELYVNMVRAGEAGGILPRILTKLGEFLEQSEAVRRFIISSSIYPSILLSVGFLSVIVIVGFVVPRFSEIFADIGQQLPLSTRMLMAGSDFLQHWWPAFLAAIAGLVVGGRWYLRTPAGRGVRDRALLRLPGLGTLGLDIQVSRFSRTLGTLIQSGVPLLKAIAIAGKVVANSVITAEIERLYQQVKTGKRISALMREGGVFPIKLVQMVTLGEETGQIGRMFEAAANELDRTIEIRIKRYLALVEPIAILLMGLVIGAVVISMLSAILGINDITF